MQVPVQEGRICKIMIIENQVGVNTFAKQGVVSRAASMHRNPTRCVRKVIVSKVGYAYRG